MTPLQSFLDTSKKLAARPMDFWPDIEQTAIKKNSAAAILKLKAAVEAKQLTGTHAHKILISLEKTVSANNFQEVKFIQALGNLADVYRHSPAPDKEISKFIDSFEKNVVKAKSRILEHHLLLERLAQQAEKKNVEEQYKSDRNTINKIGIFYVLEYTLQVLLEFTRLSDSKKQELLSAGLKTPAGNLPAYYPLEGTFRKELCYKIFDSKLRRALLLAFYELEETLYSKNLSLVGQSLKKFNVALLRAFQNKGLKTFRGMVYTPFGNDVTIDELIQTLSNLIIN